MLCAESRILGIHFLGQLPALFSHRCNRTSHELWLDFVLSHALVYKIQARCAQHNLLTSVFLLVGLLWLSYQMLQFFKTLQSSRGIQLQSSSFFSLSFFSENVLLSSPTFREKSMVTQKMTQQRRFCQYCYKTFQRMCTHYTSAV